MVMPSQVVNVYVEGVAEVFTCPVSHVLTWRDLSTRLNELLKYIQTPRKTYPDFPKPEWWQVFYVHGLQALHESLYRPAQAVESSLLVRSPSSAHVVQAGESRVCPPVSFEKLEDQKIIELSSSYTILHVEFREKRRKNPKELPKLLQQKQILVEDGCTWEKLCRGLNSTYDLTWVVSADGKEEVRVAEVRQKHAQVGGYFGNHGRTVRVYAV